MSKAEIQTELHETQSSTELERGPESEIGRVDDDEALTRKLHLINNALDQIGFTLFHLKLFCVAGFGYAADSQLEMIQSSVKAVVDRQYKITYPISTEIFYVGLMLGSIFWGFGGDIIGRKIAFNTSLLLAAVFGLFAGGTSSYAMYCIMMGINAFCAGGNIALDVTVFLEFSPSKYSWITTFLASWWGVGQTIAVLLAWAFVPNFSCESKDNCPSHLNRGWRYCWYANSGIVLFFSLLRLFWLKLDETPKYLVSNGRDAEAIEVLQKISKKYNRRCDLTLEDLLQCGEVKVHLEEYSIKSVTKVIVEHVKVLYSNSKVAYSTSLIFLSWFLIGVCYNTFFNFLYIYIALHGGNTGTTLYVTYRNSALSNFVGIFGPMVASYMVSIPRIGRKGTMMFGALAGMAILFGYTTVRDSSGDAGFASATYFFMNMYYGVLYAYTPEVFPAVARTTGGAIALFAGRFAGAFAPLIYYYGQESGTSVPIWVCGAIIGSLAVISMLLPFEPSKQRSL